MKITNLVQGLTLSLALVASSATFAQISINISLAPPAPLYEAVPALSPGQVWAPGYWAVHNNNHVWVRGRPMLQRTGYLWQPDHWEQRNGNYYLNAGHWERDSRINRVKAEKMHKPKHDNRHHEDKKDKGHGKDH